MDCLDVVIDAAVSVRDVVLAADGVREGISIVRVVDGGPSTPVEPILAQVVLPLEDGASSLTLDDGLVARVGRRDDT